MNRELRAKLIRRIKHILSGTHSTEDGLVQLLTDIRKLLEELNESEKYPTLKLHCDWVLHAKLSGKKVQHILEKIDKVWAEWQEQGKTFPAGFEHKLMRMIALYGFEEELVRFVGTLGVKLARPDSRGAWHGFEHAYCNIVKDCWLVYPKSKPPLKYIDTARIHPIKVTEAPLGIVQYSPNDYLPMALEWIFMKYTGEAIRFTISFPSQELVERQRRLGLTTNFADVALPLPENEPQTPTHPPD